MAELTMLKEWGFLEARVYIQALKSVIEMSGSFTDMEKFRECLRNQIQLEKEFYSVE